ncbi:uncharacterized protein PHALS_14064 [Plasmopara halstedii]|uniref:Uncharacterized protein n=1 Tax=Plasmopara halstedii TaxID=4781 RepID=A0A0P1AQY0_PLAHL|nr:uncharacterized protein PHALS_14064 [Plasmopara halstedii]CEG43772.1 hypothetical protein PHALS_14064 [Plasmopara halstedii]|eukprot:XP_024580141.1 hypothetical protein PHALS_14064 [Plasmopara halstedii]
MVVKIKLSQPVSSKPTIALGKQKWQYRVTKMKLDVHQNEVFDGRMMMTASGGVYS